MPLLVQSYLEDLVQAAPTYLFHYAWANRIPPRIADQLCVLRAYLASAARTGLCQNDRRPAYGLVPFRRCRFLCKQGTLTANPADQSARPQGWDGKLPHFLGVEDVVELLDAPPADVPLGLRSARILETLYSAGLRVSELTGLNVEDVDFQESMAITRGRARHLALLRPPALEALRHWLDGRAAVMAALQRRRATLSS